MADLFKTRPHFGILLIIGILTSCSVQNDLRRAGLKGRVQNYKSATYEVDLVKGRWVPQEMREKRAKSMVSYDRMGMVDSVVRFNRDGGYTGKTIYEKENGLCTQTVMYNKDEQPIGLFIYEYDSAGAKEKEFYYTNSGLKWEKQFTEGPSGWITIKEGKATGKVERFYRWKRLVRNVYLDYVEDSKAVTFYKYDCRGNLIDQRQNSAKRRFRYSYEYLEFDKKDNWTKRISIIKTWPENGGDPEEERILVTREYEYY